MSMEMARVVVASELAKDLPEEAQLGFFNAMDLDTDEDEVLRRYESAFKSFVHYGTLQPLTKRLTANDHVQDTIIDFCTSHALQGSEYINEIQMNLQYTVLQSALILTISMTLYIETPSFNKENNLRAFSAIIGLAAFCQITVIIGCTIISALLNRPYTPADTVVARVQAQALMVFVNILNYVANAATLVAMLIAGFDRSSTDGAVQTYAGLLAVVLIYMAAISFKQGAQFQDRRTLAFYDRYCDDSGRLKPEHLRRIYAKKDE